jgi:hypothetical protein
MIAKYFARSLAIEKVVSAPRVISSCLPDLHHVDELGRVGVQVDHVAGLLGRGRPSVHRHPDVDLGERRGVVGAIAGHRNKPATLLLAPDQRHLILGGGLSEEVVHPRLGRDHLGGQRVVTGDHDGLDAHRPQLGEPLGHAGLDHVGQLDHAKNPGPAGDYFGTDQRGSPLLGDLCGDPVHLGGHRAAT